MAPSRASVRHGVGDHVEPVDVEAGLHEGRCEVPAAADAVVLEPVAEGVLAIAGLHRGQRRRLRDPLDRGLLQCDQRLQRRRRAYLPAAIMPSLCRIPATRSRSADGGADRGGGRVVQLVGEPGGQRPERQQPFPLADHLVGVLDAEEQALQQVHAPSGTTRASPAANSGASSTKNRDGSVTRMLPL